MCLRLEDNVPKTLGTNVDPYYDKEGSLFEAVINGAENGAKLIIGIVALFNSHFGIGGPFRFDNRWGRNTY